MRCWARLEGLAIEPRALDEEASPDHALATIEAAQAAGFVDPSWAPPELRSCCSASAWRGRKFPIRTPRRLTTRPSSRRGVPPPWKRPRASSRRPATSHLAGDGNSSVGTIKELAPIRVVK